VGSGKAIQLYAGTSFSIPSLLSDIILPRIARIFLKAAIYANLPATPIARWEWTLEDTSQKLQRGEDAQKFLSENWDLFDDSH